MTNPSGVTIFQDKVFVDDGSSGVTISPGNVQTDSGYMIHYDTSSHLMTAGMLDYSGTSLDRQDLGLTTIYHVVASAVTGEAGATGWTVNVGAPGGHHWTSSGVTEVCFRVWDYKGAAYSGGVSIHYIAIGV